MHTLLIWFGDRSSGTPCSFLCHLKGNITCQSAKIAKYLFDRSIPESKAETILSVLSINWICSWSFACCRYWLTFWLLHPLWLPPVMIFGCLDSEVMNSWTWQMCLLPSHSWLLLPSLWVHSSRRTISSVGVLVSHHRWNTYDAMLHKINIYRSTLSNYHGRWTFWITCSGHMQKLRSGRMLDESS